MTALVGRDNVNVFVVIVVVVVVMVTKTVNSLKSLIATCATSAASLQQKSCRFITHLCGNFLLQLLAGVAILAAII